ncbi:unnamed protein product [[Actinomadura] parvosata subsp. kistnae]|uniref:DUF1579 domain-containing protein n=1 Tax=[Actinomadura] parvosata subsp. kistnae TaxID=1909395 RepID=A0A1U9ZWS4_9ACTN|nr:hypothetical protein [Nonomuraea sp. ATCC 55076]AQZ62408.1 hypothetical protein BKM31_13885 [Nonomuraea sp. ATCC 55076]SPL88628.1 unnamed protein product [Actinomadura parvosata subsp. kistnae]
MVNDPALQALDRLVGTWKITGGHEGTVTYRWLNDFFLQQDVQLGDTHGFEIIGRERRLMAEPSPDIKSRYYGDDGSTLDYTYELEGDTLTIWAGERGSPAYFQGVFSTDGRALTGAWVYPGGGGYDSNAERVD